VRRADGAALAVKHVPLPDDAHRASFRREADALRAMAHPACLALVAARELDTEGLIVTPLHANGTLETALKRERIADRLPGWATKKTTAIVGVAFGLEALHRSGFMHRDVKAANILLDERFEPVIADLGLVTGARHQRVGDAPAPTMVVGTPLHMAPELWADAAEVYTSAVDVYAYGVMLYSMFVAEPLNMLDDGRGEAKSPQALMRRIEQGARFRRDTTAISDRYWELITKCWNGDPSERPSFSQIVDCFVEDPNSFLLPGAASQEVQSYITKMEAVRASLR
jgi:serine/threonine protein kinase